MSEALSRRLEALADPRQPAPGAAIIRGLEKEGLRVTADGYLARSAHPRALGSALTHPLITTDFAESLLEFITEPGRDLDATLGQLAAIHRFVDGELSDELLWGTSMPCQVGDDSAIPVAEYGPSNIGRMKNVYRRGLGWRYGRLMQTIAGIHYNFSVDDGLWTRLQQLDDHRGSLQDYKTGGYFALIRNFRRHFWLLLYLFGAAPAVCRSFLKGRDHSLVPVPGDEHSYYAPHATSLRMGDLGYQSDAQQSLFVCYNRLPTYIATLQRALTRPHPAYEAIGVKVDGDYRQLSANLLQIENEFYSPVRPKRGTLRGETPLRALWQRGVEYIEVRCLDVNPFLPLGIDAETIHFLDTFLFWCLLADSPPCDEEEFRSTARNQSRMVYRGRDPELTLLDYRRERPLQAWGDWLLQQLAPVAELLDRDRQDRPHRRALDGAAAKLADPARTPAGQVLAAMSEGNQTFFRFAMNQALAHREHYRAQPLDAHQRDQFAELARASLASQAALEAADAPSFEAFLAEYFSQYQFDPFRSPT